MPELGVALRAVLQPIKEVALEISREGEIPWEAGVELNYDHNVIEENNLKASVAISPATPIPVSASVDWERKRSVTDNTNLKVWFRFSSVGRPQLTTPTDPALGGAGG